MINIGIAISDWKDNLDDYQKIRGVLIDVKFLMSINVRYEEDRIKMLAELIELEK